MEETGNNQQEQSQSDPFNLQGLSPKILELALRALEWMKANPKLPPKWALYHAQMYGIYARMGPKGTEELQAHEAQALTFPWDMTECAQMDCDVIPVCYPAEWRGVPHYHTKNAKPILEWAKPQQELRLADES